jgi:anti-sigma-K factor RskA
METGIHELTAAYALDALEPEERRDYEAHLRDCESCREELASFATVTEALAVAASGPVPSRELRDRILADARAEPQVVVPFEPRRRRALPVLAAVAGVAAVAAVAVGLWAAQLSGDLDEARSALEAQRRAASVLADPASRTVGLTTGQGRLVVDPDGRAALVVDALGPAPSGKTYEVWVIEGDAPPTPAGLFPGQDGAELVLVEGTLDGGEVVAVTIEDAGGVSEPSTEPVVASDPV